MLRPELPSFRAAVVYPAPQLEVGGERPFVLFGSAWLYNNRSWLLGHLVPPGLDRLEAEHGLLIGHVYLDTFRPLSRLRGRELLQRTSPLGASERRFALRPEVDRVFQRLAARQAGRELWVAGIEAVAEHLLATMRVRLRATRDGVQLSCDDCTEGPGLSALTLRLPPPVARVEVDGEPPAGRRVRGDGLWVWFDLTRGQPRMVTLYDARGARLAPSSSSGVALDEATP